MTVRNHPIVTNEIYHIYNRSVAQQPIFRNIWENNRYLNLIDYYRFLNTPLRFSYYNRLRIDQRESILKSLYKENDIRIEIYSFSIMPNHYHILAKQVNENGISDFIRYIQDSYAKYLNKKTDRFGALFQSPFKAVRIEKEEQFIHVARYIHLNPLTSYLLKEPKELNTYIWNSWIDYVTGKPRAFVETGRLLSLVPKNKLEEFTFNQLDYQRKLENIKHLILG
ncbi:transposase [Candidatus Woesebacteria bacterium]|nr:transposase [Candidatus Woesebacteria bacterium]